MSINLIDPISNLPDIATAAANCKEAMKITSVASEVEQNLAIEKVYSYLTTIPVAQKDKNTVTNWATYLSEKYSGVESSGTYLSNSDLIFGAKLYNSLCDNIQKSYKNYLASNGSINIDFNDFFLAYNLLVSEFNLNIIILLNTLKSVYVDNNCPNQSNKRLLIIKNNQLNVLTPTSPALLDAKGIDISFNMPENFSNFYSAARNEQISQVAVRYLSAPKTNTKLVPSNKKVHRIREVSD